MPSHLLHSFAQALDRREQLLLQLHQEQTDCYRLFHGITEGFPGISIDRYGPILLLQTWREKIDLSVLFQLNQMGEAVINTAIDPVWNHRAKRASVEYIHPCSISNPIGQELGISYDIRPQHRGIDPLLFLDFRAGRRLIQQHAKGKTVLNLFSYTCGIGLVAAMGGAKEVCNVDFATHALNTGRHNAQMNAISSERFITLQEDVIAAIRQFSGLGIKGRARRRKFTKLAERQFDIVILDPPRRSKSPFGSVDIVGDYQSLFKPALLCTSIGGHMLVTNNVAAVQWDDWSISLQRCANKAGRNIELTRIIPEDDFPSPDQRWPLKMAWVSVVE